ncbi:Magnesium transporter MgtE [Posidoniimonas polymericola]|uniref:Magnesium transporter MgtE n=1 Tax=Posidoniimonas polymericola TaxID=2528002 RepID=A0A5C5XV59_9BACT|nr:magnesium transporter [Posidoniimonas polymericola]TWT66283.1 Magnesium transporter MgtE [Posidoniimonas polymericola]
MINTLYLPELREMLAENDRTGLQEFCGALHPARVAEFMEGLEAIEMWQVLQATEPDVRADIFSFVEEAKQVEIVETVGPEGISRLIADMPADDRVDLLSEVDQEVMEQTLPLLPQEDRRETLRLLGYAEGTAGALMTTEVARLSQTLTVHDALEAISRQSQDLETVYYNYVVDDQDHLLGLVSARDLVVNFTRPDTPISDLMQRDVVTVLVTDDQEAVAEKVANYNFIAIPVVDHHRKLLGIITHDDVIDVLQEEATEDAHRSASVDPLEDGYLETVWHQLAWKRGIWLTVLFVAALLTALALRGYEEDFQKVTWLVLFIPLVISSGGNTGSQSATLVIRGLTTGDVNLRDWRRVLRKELAMGLCLGGSLAAIGYLCAVMLTRSVPESADGVASAVNAVPTLWEVLVVPITLLLVVMCGTMTGGLLPLLFQRMGLDPALMSNQFVAGIVDIAGILIYMTVAMIMVPGLW